MRFHEVIWNLEDISVLLISALAKELANLLELCIECIAQSSSPWALREDQLVKDSIRADMGVCELWTHACREVFDEENVSMGTFSDDLGRVLAETDRLPLFSNAILRDVDGPILAIRRCFDSEPLHHLLVRLEPRSLQLVPYPRDRNCKGGLVLLR